MKAPEDVLTKVVASTLTERQWKALYEFCQSESFTMSTMIRRIILAELKRHGYLKSNQRGGNCGEE